LDLRRRHIASLWHTVALATVIIAVAVTGTLLSRANGGALEMGRSVPPPLAYLPTVGVAWGMALYVCGAVRITSKLALLLGRPWCVRVDLPLSLAIVASILMLHAVLSRVVPGAAASSIPLPHTLATRIAWVVLAVSVGFSEELVYRGYFITQGKWLLGGVARPVAAQAILFALAHADQGAAGVVRAAAYGLVFGAVAVMRRSLWPGIVAHVGIDVVAGLVAS
jgi:membrane protease YdiL (CAAX protease family)